MNSREECISEATAALNRPGARQVRVLTVLPDFPFPATTGLHLRMVSNLDLVRRLGCFSALLYFSTEERETAPVESAPLAAMCDEVRHGGRRFPHQEFSTAALIGYKLDFLVRGALRVPGHSYPFSMSYDRVGAEKIILAGARRLGADFVILPSMLMHYTTALRKAGFGVVVDAADVLTNLSASFLKNLSGRGGKLSLFANYLACRAQERIFLKRCDELWCTSAAEATEFQRIAPGVRVLVIPNCLDEKAIRPFAPPSEAVIGFIGTYSYTPNLQAAEFLVEEVFPHVLAAWPNAVLRLAGAHMPDDVAAKLRRVPGVEILGRVGDAGRFMEDCAVLALPVFIRGGVPLKLIEAMAHGKAVVASPELVDGLAVADGRDIIVRSKPDDFAAAIVELLGDAGRRKLLGEAARDTFLRHFSIAKAESALRNQSVLAHAPNDLEHSAEKQCSTDE
ncbi:MAG: glycosyltransferase family 4 protein [Terriglobales bacterium]|jgi:glycosyltransferase involved in cell wall biosynthesis